MSKPIDYSKWDNLDYSSDEDDSLPPAAIGMTALAASEKTQKELLEQVRRDLQKAKRENEPDTIGLDGILGLLSEEGWWSDSDEQCVDPGKVLYPFESLIIFNSFAQFPVGFMARDRATGKLPTRLPKGTTNPFYMSLDDYGKYKVEIAIQASDPAKGVTMGDAAKAINELSKAKRDALMYNSFHGQWPHHHFLEGAFRDSTGRYYPMFGS
ncbi:unnamed protein product [Vitrella brassicaformis CCMP3155]|uniref:Uncharacterized protein n=1 Tax=Vitrella brassicaformis (strain CCMP3155) TaxID=1169540 RepID=A0A0G4ERI3_VITBC|nr:unnamed protein product [Vitrella brassicaformis CCMP3155]|eukprot:CEM00879.1 unnamed protein product [Vitrella brassicaformis CCMP3155]